MKKLPTTKLHKKLSYKSQARLSKAISMLVAIIAIGGVAAIGVNQLRSSHAVAGHHAECSRDWAVVNGQHVTTVQTNQTFQGQVWFANDGDSTWTPNYAFFMGSYNGSTTWGSTGAQMTTDYPPGTTAMFNLALKAPPSPGTYAFSWQIGIVYQPWVNNPCISTLTVVAPPPNAPTLSATGATTNSINIAWNATSNTSNYSVFRNGAQIATVTTTSVNNTGLSCGTTYSYFVKANGPGGSAQSNTISRATSACPPPGGGGGGTGGGGSTGGGGTTKPPTSGGSSGGATSTPQTGTTTTPNPTDTTIVDNTTTTDSGTTDQSGSSEQAANVAPKKHSSVLKTLLKVFLVIVLLVGLSLGGLIILNKFVAKRSVAAKNEDYWRKSQGL